LKKQITVFAALPKICGVNMALDCPMAQYEKFSNVTTNITHVKKITIRRTGKRYYNPLDFKPFEFLQIDTKEVIDGNTLPADTYQHLLDLAKQNVPLYQFTAIDLRTRIRFLAYGQQQRFINGWAYMILLVLWLRSFGIRHQIIMQSDWGNEFGGISG